MTTPLFELAGTRAIVTGACGLLGPHHARALLEAGADVALVDLDARACAELAGRLGREHGGRRVLGAGCDVTDPDALARLRDLVAAELGPVDVLVNNAAVDDKVERPEDGPDASRFERFPLERFRRTLDVNVTGTFLACQVLGAPMAGRGRGSIVNVASTYGLVAPDQALYRRPDGTQAFWKGPAYPTSKAAVLGLTRFLAAYWGPAGVRVNALSPGGIENGQEPWFQERYAARTPLGRMGRRGELAGALVFLASAASSYVTGANLVVDGGWTSW
jgi:NAD(P)-dependent dehydrogenase (short-subunit alcohol dehydrogenase family)